ncbi:DUSAM domain-containing protein [Hyalangium rubrum]|uniref:DUSAM domain-containing protein n=1 Tax=Hyalangium rubrum TaxID=3103134 RepID=A0ABU5HIL8_9BACT|nr:DUSAM domain-containing protein [Hyalangium sp. s54d21]MDY7231925.1 DUSAM domain-containing protein [Hyalangium sp. s54d21]
MEHEEGEWHEIRVLDTRVQQGQAFALTEDVRALLLRSAPTVAISVAEAEEALATVESATALLRKIRERIREGSNRIGDALFRMHEFQDAGDLKGARQEMRHVLTVEVVPHYREIAEGELAKLNKLS